MGSFLVVWATTQWQILIYQCWGAALNASDMKGKRELAFEARKTHVYVIPVSAREPKSPIVQCISPEGLKN